MTSINKFEQEKYEQVQQLLQQVQATNNFQLQELVINQIAVKILRSRPLCRRFNGKPLTGVYQEIYDQAKEQLVALIQQHSAKSSLLTNGNHFSNYQQLTPDYLYSIQTEIFQRILNDNQLKKLCLNAQNFLVNSELRTYALTELIKAIKLSGKLCRPHMNKFPPNLYNLLYQEALSETYIYICLNIDLYDPERGQKKFMNWVNFNLDKLLLKCYERYNKYSKYELSSFQDLEQIKQPFEHQDLSKLLRQYLSQDPDNIFREAYIRNRPNANFRQIALAKFSGQSWIEISLQLDIPVSTLSSFYNRWCRRFAPILKTELKKYL
ncbi:hypothetical protein [Pleurocapsa sp. PCC 7319]|uniref:hypothetical protein n=1 Tax=Pleurocapsa sp. PCC 7319 TaxID=118161 RepID=UPI00034D3879|nr:hypothetical protein [Pleurocapsa sp. PCC 7319]